MLLEKVRGEGVGDRPAVHILTDRKPEKRQNRGSDVQDGCLLQNGSPAKWLSFEYQDAVFPVPVGGLAVADPRVGERAVLTGAKSVVGANHDGRGPDRFEQTADHLVCVPVVLMHGPAES